MMGDRVIHAPLNMPSQIIDVGCGTGAVTRHLGETYSSAKVYGIDISPVPTTIDPNPPKVEYILGDIREVTGQFTPGSIDLIFSRLLVMGMTDWPAYIRDMASLLRPGGWMEMHDLSNDWYLHGTHCSEDWEWLKALYVVAERKGWDLRCGKNIKKYMEEAGLVDVSVVVYRVPLGPWMEKPETKRIGTHLGKEQSTLFYHAMPKALQGMGYTKEKVEELRNRSSMDTAPLEGKEMRFYVTFGRKP
ncbi:MAG: hypothetical protein Q9169_008657 [Polycauliona sp. 2 TL-2023]